MKYYEMKKDEQKGVKKIMIQLISASVKHARTIIFAWQVS